MSGVQPLNCTGNYRFIRFHSFQCVFFTVAWTVLWIALNIIAHIPLLGWLTILI